MRELQSGCLAWGVAMCAVQSCMAGEPEKKLMRGLPRYWNRTEKREEDRWFHGPLLTAPPPPPRPRLVFADLQLQNVNRGQCGLTFPAER